MNIVNNPLTIPGAHILTVSNVIRYSYRHKGRAHTRRVRYERDTHDQLLLVDRSVIDGGAHGAPDNRIQNREGQKMKVSELIETLEQDCLFKRAYVAYPDDTVVCGPCEINKIKTDPNFTGIRISTVKFWTIEIGMPEPFLWIYI